MNMDRERLANIAGWISNNMETWKRMCRSGEADRLQADEEAAEAAKALSELTALGYYELIMVFFSLNMSVLGDGILRYMFKVFSDHERVDEINSMLEEIITTFQEKFPDKFPGSE